MTTRTCAACGVPAPPPFRPPAAEQAPDLDLRPGEPARSTLRRWVATCRGCGACAPDLATLPPVAADAVRSDSYRALEAPAATLPFLRWAMICDAAGLQQDEIEATLRAAWTRDDAEDTAGAAALRTRAALLWDTIESVESGLRLIDVYRRAGDFERAARLAGDLPAMRPLDEASAGILAFQQDRIVASDTGRYLISSALRPPARTPHVAHGRHGKRGGLWRRLLGR